MSIRSTGCLLGRWLGLQLPAAAAFALAESASDAQWRGSAVDRAAVTANLAVISGRRVHGHHPEVREVFRNFGRYLLEFFTVDRKPFPTVEVSGAEHLERAVRRGGAIVLTAHLGNWELGAMAIRRMTGAPVMAVALPHADPSMDRLFNRQRARCGVEVIPLGPGAAKAALRHLGRGGLLGVLGDREFGAHGLAGSLCGERTFLPRGPAVLSLRARVPMIPAFMVREGRWSFRLRMEPPILPVDYRVSEASVNGLVQEYAVVLERYLTEVPSQWLMFQSMFKRREAP